MRIGKEVGPGVRRYWVYLGPLRVRVPHWLWLPLGGNRMEVRPK